MHEKAERSAQRVGKVLGRVMSEQGTWALGEQQQGTPGQGGGQEHPHFCQPLGAGSSGEGPGTSSQVKDRPSKTLTENLFLAKMSILAHGATGHHCEPQITW